MECWGGLDGVDVCDELGRWARAVIACAKGSGNAARG
jgi:hypothetical protein